MEKLIYCNGGAERLRWPGELLGEGRRVWGGIPAPCVRARNPHSQNVHFRAGGNSFWTVRKKCLPIGNLSSSACPCFPRFSGLLGSSLGKTPRDAPGTRPGRAPGRALDAPVFVFRFVFPRAILDYFLCFAFFPLRRRPARGRPEGRSAMPRERDAPESDGPCHGCRQSCMACIAARTMARHSAGG